MTVLKKVFSLYPPPPPHTPHANRSPVYKLAPYGILERKINGSVHSIPANVGWRGRGGVQWKTRHLQDDQYSQNDN